ncbi:MAG: YdbL family protein [Myxococcota bacterium]|nr:YdbL family protein [Myxococcota bacterium]
MSIPVRRLVNLGLCLLLLIPLASTALADSLDQAKAAGHVGEQADGYLGTPPGAPASASALAAEINAKRKARYQAIAAKNGTGVSVVAKLAGQKLTARAPSGQYIRNSAGTWQKKP